MRRLGRRTLARFYALSFALCVTTATLWLSSYFCSIGWRYFDQDSQYSWTSDLETVRGGFQWRQDVRPPYPFRVRDGFESRDSQATWVEHTVLGFGHSSFQYGWGNATATRHIVTIPWYPFFALTAISTWLLRAAVWCRYINEWRLRNNYCLRCGYNLAGNVSGVCPECGTEVPRLNV
jgi:hypothetical protein